MEDRQKSGRVYVVYDGVELNHVQIKNELRSICPSKFTVKCVDDGNLLFAKIVYNEYVDDRDPFYNVDNEIITVSGYNQDEIMEAIRVKDYNITDSDQCHYLINHLYSFNNTDVFKILKQYMNFSSVIYNRLNKTMVAGVTTPNNEFTHLYYGFTKEKRELIYSNNKEILEKFCYEVYEMENNTYIKDKIIYDLNGNMIKNIVDVKNNNNNINIPFIGDTSGNAQMIINALNALLNQVANDEVRKKVENNIDEYLKSDDPKKKITDYILNELDIETKKQILEIIKKEIENANLAGNLGNELDKVFEEKLEEYSNKLEVPLIHVVKLNDTVLGQTSGGFYHEKFEQILTQVQLDEPIMLIGPAGSGKNHAISQIAQALGQHMYYTNNATNEFKLTGFIDAGGNYRDTEFYKAFKNGGIFFLDEIDNSDPSALIVINSALANGYMAFPHETIDRHKDFRMIAAANTWGKGADLEYVGRNALDAATLDRFDNIFFDYDRELERHLYPNDEVLEFMWAFRDAILKTKIPHIISTRGIGKVYKKAINGIPIENTLTSNVVKNLGQDDLNTIIGAMENISSSNRYYDGVKRLRLGR